MDFYNDIDIIYKTSLLDLYGVKFLLCMFFSLFLFIIIQMRAVATMKSHHIIALCGSLFLFFKYLISYVFEYGYYIKLYTDPRIHLSYQPIEHFFYILGILCLSYYTFVFFKLDFYKNKYLTYGVPLVNILIFLYMTISQSSLICKLPQYTYFFINWQSHFIMLLISCFTLVVISKFKIHYLSIFWCMLSVEHILNFYYSIYSDDISIWLYSIEIWSLLILCLHFIKMYSRKLKFCETCRRFEFTQGCNK